MPVLGRTQRCIWRGAWETHFIIAMRLFVCCHCSSVSMQLSINLSSFESLLSARDVQNNTHLVKLKPSEGSDGRPPHPKKKKKHRRSGVSPEEAFEKEYFSKPKHKPSHGVSLCLVWVNCMPIQNISQIVWFDHIRISQVFPSNSESTEKNQIISNTSNQDYADGSASDYDEDGPQER